MPPFQPLTGQARWKTLYGRLRKRGVGSVLTYEEMGELLGLDPDGDRDAIQRPILRAAKQLEKINRLSVVVVRGVGYRVVEVAQRPSFASHAVGCRQAVVVRDPATRCQWVGRMPTSVPVLQAELEQERAAGRQMRSVAAAYFMELVAAHDQVEVQAARAVAAEARLAAWREEVALAGLEEVTSPRMPIAAIG